MANDVADEKNLTLIRQQLEQRKVELDKEMSDLYQEKFSDDQVQDSADQALSSTMESLRVSMHDAKNSEYKRIVQALHMIDAGTYGICVDCSKVISDKRLKHYPNATRCLLCQEAFEEQTRPIE